VLQVFRINGRPAPMGWRVVSLTEKMASIPATRPGRDDSGRRLPEAAVAAARAEHFPAQTRGPMTRPSAGDDYSNRYSNALRTAAD
jgi:hypothetical protein